MASHTSKPDKAMMSSIFKKDVGEGGKGEGGAGKLQALAKAIQVQMALSRRAELRNGVAADRVLYARQLKSTKPPVTEGECIGEEYAISLRTAVFGTAKTPVRSEWLRTALVFRDPEKEDSYLLKCGKNSTRGLISVLQAEIIKYLLFNNNKTKEEAQESFKIDKDQQAEALIRTISTVLWRIGEKTKVVLCLPQEKAYLTHSGNYFQDTITEKLHLIEVNDYEELQIIVKRYLYLFTDDPGPGSLLLLYSAIATRTPTKVLRDMEGGKGQLISSEEEGSLCVVTLLLTGRATPYLHNGVVYVGDEDHYAIAQFGILSRSEIGLLVEGSTELEEENVPGSRLKTPSLPVWVTSSVGHFAVMYNTNRELLHNYHAERRFDLTYVSCGGNQAHLTVDTRQSYRSNQSSEEPTPTNVSNVERLVHTKWPDAQITWHGTTP